MRVGGGVHFRIRLEHNAIRSHKIGDAFGDRDQGARRADRLRQLVVAIAEEAERKRVFFGELPVILRGVVGDPEHFDPDFLELVPAVPQPPGLQSSTGSVGLRVEVKQKRATLEVGARHRGAIVGFELETGEWFADGNHVSSASSVADRGAHRRQ